KELNFVNLFNSTRDVPPTCLWPLIPFRFDVVAAATAMTRDEFIAHATAEAEQLRQAVIADSRASQALLVLAADQQSWKKMYLASLEESGLLHPADGAPPVLQYPQMTSL